MQAGTNVNPWKPSLSLVTVGIFGWMRNPMYVGLMLILAGLAIALASDWTLVLLVPAALILHFGAVKREERYLKAKFGESYQRLCEQSAAVRLAAIRPSEPTQCGPRASSLSTRPHRGHAINSRDRPSPNARRRSARGW